MVVPNKPRKQALTTRMSAHKLKSIMRRAKNLYLDPEAIEHGEQYSRLHRTNLSQLVSDFLRSLPLKSSSPAVLSPVVQRLVGVGISRKTGKPRADVEDYRRHLKKKYGD
jgi:Family of unknown function (DUF6364)